MKKIDAYETLDGSIFSDPEDAKRHLEMMQQPHADIILKLLRDCDGKVKNFSELLTNPTFFNHVAAFDAMRQDMVEE